MNPDCSEFTKNLIIDIYAEKLKTPEIEILVDPCDAGVLYTGKRINSIKNQLTDISRVEYEKAQKAVIKKYIMRLHDKPEIFAMDAAQKMLLGISIQEYISYIEKCSYEKFVKLCSIADYKISEAQVIFRKEMG